MKKDETVMSLTEMVKDHRENKAKDGNQNEFDILSQRASEFSRDHSLMKGGTPTPGDEVHGHIELFAKNEQTRYDHKFRELNGYRTQSLFLKDFTHCAIRETEFVQLYDIAEQTTELTQSTAKIEKQFAGITGQYAVSKLLTGSDEAFWQNEREVASRPNRYDCGMDIPGRKIDVKSTHLSESIKNYSILDMHLAVTPQYMSKDTTYIQAFVGILNVNLCHANVYIAGWADIDHFPEVGKQWKVEHFKRHRCLYTFQLNPFPPYWFVDKHDSFLGGDLKFKPWRHHVCTNSLKWTDKEVEEEEEDGWQGYSEAQESWVAQSEEYHEV